MPQQAEQELGQGAGMSGLKAARMDAFSAVVRDLRTVLPSGTVDAVEDAEAVLLLQTKARRKFVLGGGREFRHRGVLLKRLHGERAWSAPVPVHVSNVPMRKLGNGRTVVAFLQESLLEAFSKSGRFYVDPGKPGVARGFFDTGVATTLSGVVVELDEGSRGSAQSSLKYVYPCRHSGETDAKTVAGAMAVQEGTLVRELRAELDLLVAACNLVDC